MSLRDTLAGFVRNTGLEKAELIPDVAWGDGRPYDAGYDRALAYNYNGFIDRKSAHQNPSLWDEPISAAQGIDQTFWMTLLAGPVYLGQDLLSTAITRELTVAPFYRSSGALPAVPGIIRITLARMKPQEQASSIYNTNGPYSNPLYAGESSQTATWQTASTTWQTGDDKTLSINAKDLTWGYAWLVIEGTSEAECRGLAKCVESPRITQAG